MLMTWLLLFGSLLIILLGCEFFTNGVEWAGRKLHLGEGAVGSVLAAVGTCLPETLIALLAIFFGARSGAGAEVGIGAILGAPLMLSTLAFFITGAAVILFSVAGKRSVRMRVHPRVVGRDLRFFFVVFSLSAAASWLPSRSLKYAAAAALVTLYVVYVRQTFADHAGDESDEDLSPLHFFRGRKQDPPLWLVLGQLFAGLALLVYGARLFVGELTAIAMATGIRPLVLSLVLTPVATELPETFNSILWVRRKKDTLALGNISGAMVFQSSGPPAVGMLFTPWVLDRQALGCVVVAILSSAVAWAEMTWKGRLSPYSLLLGGLFYAVYLGWIFGSS
jgi:cation:H+ antiporter